MLEEFGAMNLPHWDQVCLLEWIERAAFQKDQKGANLK